MKLKVSVSRNPPLKESSMAGLDQVITLDGSFTTIDGAIDYVMGSIYIEIDGEGFQIHGWLKGIIKSIKITE